ncbi:hypothetical protein GCM10012280_37310 [Wenjunlia tyrosinilytica]|uniref:Uncharacterized protein n=1 Tax=Wenjunlia tyrosinilytica TaxID=1544741 RepID=A0A917ZS79_9ACTN|nr:hypothetical protein GCM10012280_37310 [Wenjunlia tyrosinilytica]
MPSMWATRYSSMSTPVVAMTAFLPTVDPQSVRRADGLAVLVASAMVIDGRTDAAQRSKTWCG